ncbi:MAG: 23S rRNA (uracil(1939)-C(5))-methyltransferase RlmD [Melioribacteraceae bacterium]|nr:23S rRNA (uracil(1939)-C(5))-methyltransferase RlmD [Melioribacteraceae bacterium]
MKKGDLLELNITGYAYEGKGIAKIIKEANSYNEEEIKKFVIFVEGSYPGDKVTAQIIRVRKSYAEAKTKELIIKSPLRTDARCRYFGICGGCKQQNLLYEHQLNFKEEQVNDIFERIGGMENHEKMSIVPSEEIFYYRNKMEYSFAVKRWLNETEIDSMQEITDQNFALGLHIPGLYDKVLDINECWLQSELSNKILNLTRAFFKDRNTTIFSTKTHEGFLRNLVIKQSHSKLGLMVNLVVSNENEELLNQYKEVLLSEIPQITTIVININRKKAQVATGDYEIVIHGDGFIYDTIGDYKFRISANSFFQTHTRQAEKLYKTAADFANLSGDEVVYDLYSGAGTIPIFIHRKVKQIFGFESVAPAIEDAKVNIDLNEIKNFEPMLVDLNKSFLPLIDEKKIPLPDLIIADPPRGGMHPQTIKDILLLSPQKIVYISCNPTTQARDIKLLCDNQYELVKTCPVDMFPHTYHIENVALLIKKEVSL